MLGDDVGRMAGTGSSESGHSSSSHPESGKLSLCTTASLLLNLPCKGVESGGSLNNTLSRKPCGQNSDKDCSSTACAGDIGFILVSSGCCNNMPHSRWLKTIEIYSFTVLEARCPKSRCEQDGLLGRLWRGTCSMPFSSILVMASDPWHSLPC